MTQLKETKHNVIFICKTIKDVSNSTRYQRCNALSQKYNVILICKTEPSDRIHSLLYRSYYFKTLFILKSLFKIYRLNNNMDVYFIHTQYSIDSSLIGFFSKLLWGIKWVYDLWDHPSLEFQLTKGPMHYYKKMLWLVIGRNIVKMASIWIIGMHKNILTHLPDHTSHIPKIYIPNGISKDSYRVLCDSRQKAYKDFECSDEMVIGCAGWILLERGINEILHALSSNKLNDTKLKVYLLGNSDEATISAIQRYNAQYQHRVVYLGNCPHEKALNIIKSCDVLICILCQNILNYRYAYPIKIFEYLATGKITIATRTDATREIIINGYNGFLIDNDPIELTNLLHDIFFNYKKYETAGFRGKLTAQKYFWEDVNRLMLDQLEIA